MLLNLTKDSTNRKADKQVKNDYFCAKCGKECHKKKVTRRLVHYGYNATNQFCTKECKSDFIDDIQTAQAAQEE